jgi:hypothetical protein
MRIDSIPVGAELPRFIVFAGRLTAGFSFLGAVLSVSAWSAVPGRPLFALDPAGLVAPFKAKALPLPDFVAQYARFSSKHIDLAGKPQEELKGTVSLFMPRALKPESLTEVFHQVLLDNGFSVIDAPAQAGWIVLRTRDARDARVPIYAPADVPATYRMVTTIRHLEHVSAENAARTLRSFTTASSRVIPLTRSDIALTTDGHNVRKAFKFLDLIDVPAAAAVDAVKRPRSPACPGAEQRIEKLTVENLEIRGTNGATFNPSSPPPPAPPAPAPAGKPVAAKGGAQ